GTQASVTRALRLIEDGALDEADVEQLAARVGLGARQLRRLFVAHVGATPQAVAANRRLLAAKQLISDTDMAFSDIAFASGFQSLRRFNDAVKASYGVAPTGLRRGAMREHPGEAITLRLGFRPPFNWPQLLGYLSFRAIPGVEEISATRYRRTFRLGDATGIIDAKPSAKPNALDVSIRSEGQAPIRQVAARMRRIFDLDADPAAIAAALSGDPVIGPRLKRVKGLRVPGAFDGFELAIRAILGQQVSVKGATTLAGRLVQRCGEALALADGTLTHIFPAPAALAGADLSGLGLTGGRISALKAFASAVTRGEVSLSPGASLENKIAELCAVPGIGAWTAHYIALRAIGEPDAFPAADLGLRKSAGGGVPVSTRVLEEMSEAWRPWRGYAALALWMAPDVETKPMAAQAGAIAAD
ncbi:MAG TPA: AlkA N-terminal domain-containing protein, partial [Parvibaculum sp.]